MSRRAFFLLTAALLVAVTGVLTPTFSTAAFTATTTNTPSTVTAAADWTPPTVALRDPGASVRGTVALTADAADAETGVQAVTIEYLAPGAAWAPVCTTATAPYTCAWATGALPDGSYALRARATDRAGYEATSAELRTAVANSLLLLLAAPGDVVRGSVPLTASLYGAGSVTYAVQIQYALADSGQWKDVCSRSAAPYTCTWVTTSVAGGEYDLRAVATAGKTVATSAVLARTVVDNQAPTVTMTDPGSPLAGTRTLTAVAADAISGIKQVVIEYAKAGTTSFAPACTVTAAPWACRFDTTTLADGAYAFRAVATDGAGNTATSAAVTDRLIENIASSVSLEDPGAYLSGTVTLRTTARSTAGIRTVTIQRAAAGTTGWTDVCAGATAGYACTWDTTTVPNGSYDLRAVLVDRTGATTVSAILAGRRVDNPLRALDVQTVNGGKTEGLAEPNDRVIFTYSQQVNLSSISAGWTGAAIPVTVRMRDGQLLGLGGKDDTLDVQRAGAAVNLGTVNLREDHVKATKQGSFEATMTASTTVVGGVARTIVTLTLGAAVDNNGWMQEALLPAAMIWSPAPVTSITGNAGSTAPVTETGPLDRDF
ncbi:Ig-like domain-containing protein [Georgenia ruanii]|uniref:Signal peptidase I n=1 Tax=Georgenia ruanii TaxID=348442 RepID=A0A7J9UY56_9MICO|nr:Ig-like domain-containing protein [Georgenia ruanii]MPV89556.1 signal peptidase I [Georgenia ruanii]